jgi:hypothetical protein
LNAFYPNFAVIHNIDNKSGQFYLSYQLIISFICYIKSTQPNLIEEIASNKIDSKTLIEKTGLKNIDKNTEYKYIYRLTEYVEYDLADDEQKKKLEEEGIKIDDGFLRRDSTNIMVTVCSWLTDMHRQK